jgi:hypothetical protein
LQLTGRGFCEARWICGPGARGAMDGAGTNCNRR